MNILNKVSIKYHLLSFSIIVDESSSCNRFSLTLKFLSLVVSLVIMFLVCVKTSTSIGTINTKDINIIKVEAKASSTSNRAVYRSEKKLSSLNATSDLKLS